MPNVKTITRSVTSSILSFSLKNLTSENVDAIKAVKLVYFILKALFVLKIFLNFCLDILVM